ncbi:unnamed protein product [Mytilus coruscus]|uniref:Uncharacterized protein n=1 Tax=Mytilus coruscus TaxID=42192 RepID=A0A6J8EMQ0_MYTCO|nr:unnamed protein product [Mytilus coruscus]
MNAEELLSEQIVENINIDDEAEQVNGSLQEKNAKDYHLLLLGIACRSNKMASALAMMLGGAITNAFAFSGSNYLFSHMGSNANEEKIRHDKAIEKLEKAQAEWNKKRIQRLDFLNEQLQKEHHAEHTFEDVDQAMKQYYYITSKQLTPLSPKPKLSDFLYTIRRSKNREIAFVVGGMVLTGFVVWKLK